MFAGEIKRIKRISVLPGWMWGADAEAGRVSESGETATRLCGNGVRKNLVVIPRITAGGMKAYCITSIFIVPRFETVARSLGSSLDTRDTCSHFISTFILFLFEFRCHFSSFRTSI